MARFYRTDESRYAAVSNEITGYALSTYEFLVAVTGMPEYAEAATRTAAYLTDRAWDIESSTYPFEPLDEAGSGFTYFFDTGIIVRGLLAAWRRTRAVPLLHRAQEAALSMAFDFPGDGDVHPILELPEKQPTPRDSRWSRQPGCYQLKSALAWRDLAQATGDSRPRAAFEQMLGYALASHTSFLPGDADRERVMDRLHAYCYFLEALLNEADRPECAAALREGIARTAGLLRDIAPVFVRSDVNAQLLRVRLWADALGVVPLDEPAAREEAAAAASFQCLDSAPSHAGGFWFGRRGGKIAPFLNPVSTAFCSQALWMWEQRQRGAMMPPVTLLI